MPTTTDKQEVADSADKSGQRDWLIAIFIIAMMPLLQAVMTWDMDGKLNNSAYAMRHFSFPAILCELCVIAIAVINRAKSKDLFRKIPKTVRWLLAIWAMMALYATFSESRSLTVSVITLGRYFLHGFTFFALALLIANARNFDAIKWYKILSIGAFLYMLSLTIFALLVPDPANFEWILKIPSATNARQIANNMAVGLVAPVALLLYAAPSKKWAYCLCIAAITAFIAWTGSRTAIVGLGFGGILALFALWSLPQLKAIFLVGLSGAAGLVASVILPIPAQQFGLFRIFSAMTNTDNFASGRDQTWSVAISQIKENPLWGYGAGRYAENTAAFVKFPLNHPHNVILQYIYDWGLFGGGAALLLLGILGWKICRAPVNMPVVNFAAAMAFFSVITMSMIEGALFHPIPIILAMATIIPVFHDQLMFDKSAANTRKTNTALD